MQFWPRGGWVDSVPLATRQGQLDLTTCDPCGTRRVGRARRGGVGLSGGVPGWPRRAQRARHPLPAAGRVPLRGGAQQCQLNRTACNRYGTQRVGRAVRDGAGRLCWAIACGGGPPPRARTSCTGCTRAWSCDATHGTVARAGWSQRAACATLHRPWSLYATGTGPQHRPQAPGRHDGARARSRRARARAAGMFEMGDKQCT